MKSIYRNEQSKKAVWKLYDRQMEDLEIPYTDLFVDTSFGKTHVIECGNLRGKPLLIFHGGNATTAYNLKYCGFLLNDFHIYAVDTIGHPGKSAEVSLSPRNQDYGKWAVDVIKGLGFHEMACFGGSFGAGILVKAMCVAPEVIQRSVLIVPSAIQNAPTYKSINMAFPMLMYWLTHKEKSPKMKAAKIFVNIKILFSLWQRRKTVYFLLRVCYLKPKKYGHKAKHIC